MILYLLICKHKNKVGDITSEPTYSKVSIKRPMLLEFEKKIVCTGRLIEIFPNTQTRSFNRDQKLAVAALK